jgi:PAS domain-containing protein
MRVSMQFASQTGEPEQRPMSASISAALIDSLFEASGPLLAGIVFVAISAALTAIRTGQSLIWACVGFLIVSGAVRVLIMHRYQARKSDQAREGPTQWQKLYQIGAMLQAISIGTWCSTTLLCTDDAVAHMICLSVTTGIAAGGAGRAYGRQWIFQLQVTLVFGPTVIALAWIGTPYYIAMSVISAAFLLSLMGISANLHRIFMRAILAREREAALAGQFDTALNNMPHGLCMFGPDARLAVMNHRFSELMILPNDLLKSGANASDIVTGCIESGSVTAESGRAILDAV